MPRLKLLEMDIDNKMIYFRKDDKLIAFDADVAIELISDSLDGKNEPVRHGHWINHFDDLFPEDSSVECSVCHEYEGIMANDNYCPNCGAKMDEEGIDDVVSGTNGTNL